MLARSICTPPSGQWKRLSALALVALVALVSACGSSAEPPELAGSSRAAAATTAPIEHASSGLAASSSAEVATASVVANEASTGSSLSELKAREAAIRSIDDALFVEAGHAERARADARRWAEDLATDPKLLEEGGAAAFGMRLALDAAVAPIVLAAVARIDTPDARGELASDFLDDLVRRGDPAGRLTLLARDLRDLKTARSKALAVALELDAANARNCEGARHVLGRVRADGDDRALPGIARLGKAKGCGPKGDDDCFPCLRDADAAKRLSAAAEAARARPFRPSWRVGTK